MVALLLSVALAGCSAESPGPVSSPTKPIPKALPNAESSPANHPPAIRSASIFPSTVTLDSTLQVEIQGEDQDGDRLTYKYQWSVNGSPLPDAVGPSFATEQLRKGDQITVALIPNDGKADGPLFTTPSVTVGNTPPVVDEIRLEPVPLHRGEILRARVKATDPDNDQIQLSYKWYRNGKELPGATADTLETKLFRKKDVLGVLVTASDGSGARDPMMSIPVEIQNGPPKILSEPPTTMGDGQYVYQIVAKDPDEDPVTYELKQGPDGMTVDPTTGMLVWKLTPESTGKHQVVIGAKDAEGAVTLQDFQIQLTR